MKSTIVLLSTFVATLLLSFGNSIGQVPDFWGNANDRTDSVVRYHKHEKDSFELVYKFNKNRWYETAVGYTIRDSSGKTNEAATEQYYIDDRHYWASVTVYKLVGLDLKREIFYENIEGFYVPHGCYEDYPQAYINEAIKRRTKK